MTANETAIRQRGTAPARLFATWRYAGGAKRDLRLDLLRGFAAFAMIVDHIGGDSSWLFWLTGGNRFFVSAAEAFVFISGVVMGMVYGNVIIRSGARAAAAKALHRAWTLYLVTVFLTLTFAAMGRLFHLWWSPDFGREGVGPFILKVATLHQTIFLVDIILLYVLLLILAVPVLFLLARGYWALILGVSLSLWALWQFEPGAAELPWHIEGNTVFNLAAWQVLFVFGIVIGFQRIRVERWLRHFSRPEIFVALSIVALAVISLYILQLTDLEALRADKRLDSYVFEKSNVPAGRLLVFCLLGVFAFTVTTVAWQPLRRGTAWLLLPLGQNSLTAYSLHIFLVGFVVKATTTFWAGVSQRAWFQTGLQAGGVLLVWLIVVLEPIGKERVLKPAAAVVAAWRRPPVEAN